MNNKTYYCCPNCLDERHQTISNYINKNGILGDCNFCLKKSIKVIEASELRDFFLPILNLYTPAVEFMGIEQLKEYDSSIENRFVDKLIFDWEVFSDDLTKQGNEGEYLEAIFQGDEHSLYKLDQSVMIEGEYYGDHYVASQSFFNSWNDFKKEIVEHNRYFPQKTLNLDLLKQLLVFYEYSIDENENWFRVRIHDEYHPDSKKLECEQMMAPPPPKARSLRANPVGIPYLYLSSNPETALLENRPTRNDYATLARLRSIKQIQVIDLGSYNLPSPFERTEEELLDFLRYSRFLTYLAAEISKPVNPSYSELEYIPLQYIFEFMKVCGYKGVIYRSFLSNGINLVIFDPKLIGCSSTCLVRIENLEQEIKYQEITK